jgi:hypothetical protein
MAAAQLIGQSGKAVGAACGQDKIEAFRGENAGELRTDTGRRTRNQRRAALSLN